MKSNSATLTLKRVVTAFLRYNGKILLVCRSEKVGSYQGHWSGISGYLEDPTPLQQVLREIKEETGLSDMDIHLVSQGDQLEISDSRLATHWRVYPFLFDIDDPDKIRLDWENKKLIWIAPQDIDQYPTVPGLADAFAACIKNLDVVNPRLSH